MESPCWKFARDDERIELRREDLDNGVTLVVAGEGVPRVFTFPDIERLVRFQADMEAFLLRTGWRFVEFTPERRAGIERRGFPRITTERRRWWTDSVRLFLNQKRHRAEISRCAPHDEFDDFPLPKA